jgi:hypothetical protein
MYAAIPVDPCMKRASFGASVIAVAAGEQNTSGLQTQVDADQRCIRIHAPIGQHSYAKGLQTHEWANMSCEHAKGWSINAWYASASFR